MEVDIMEKFTEKEMKKSCTGGVKWYRQQILSMVEKINDIWILEQIHKFIINMTKEGD